MSIYPQHSPSYPNNYNNHSAISNLTALTHNPYIDSKNLPLLTSRQYMRNYTYLQYCMFPQLFSVYLQQLDYQQLRSLFDSYMNMLMEFFVEGVNYSVAYQGVLVGEYFVDRIEKRVKGIEGYDNVSSTEILERFSRELNQIKQTLVRGNPIDTSLLTQLSKIIDFLQLEYQLPDIMQRLKKDAIVHALFSLICTMIRHLITNNCHNILNSFPRCKYLIYAALWKITQENAKLEVTERPIQQIVDMLQVKIVPIEMELNQFFACVKRAQTKDSSLVGLLNGALGNVGKYIKLFRLIKSIDQFVREFKRQQIKHVRFDLPPNHKNSSITDLEDKKLSLSQIITTIEKCIKGTEIIEMNNLMEGQWIQRRNIEIMKELTVQNVQKIAKLFSRVTLTHKDQIDQEMKLAERRKPLRLAKTITSPHRQRDMRKLLDVQFLVQYKQLCSLSYTIQQTPCNQHSQTPQTLNTTSDLIQQLFQTINHKLTSITRLVPEKLQDTRQKVELLSYQCTLLVEAVNDVSDRIRSSLNENEGTTMQEVQKVNEKLIKIKSSLLTNVLTLKVLFSAFNKQHQQSCRQNNIQPEDQDHQRPMTDLHEISQLFGQIMLFSIESAQPNQSSSLPNKTSDSQPQIKTLPCLQNILLMFGSIQLWNQCHIQNITSQNPTTHRTQKPQISQFMQKVVKQYSQQNIKIDSHEILYVERILTLLQVYQDVNKKTDIVKVDEYLMKMVDMKKNKGLNVADVVNSQEVFQTLLELLALKVIAGCFPKSQANNQRRKDEAINQRRKDEAINQRSKDLQENEFSEGLYKIPIWKIITLGVVSQQLKSQQVVQFIVNGIIQPQKDIFQCLKSQKLSQKSSNIPIVNIDKAQTNANKILEIVMREYPGSSQSSSAEVFQIFIQLKNKYLKLIEYKQQIKLEGSGQIERRGKLQELREQRFGNELVFEKERRQMMIFNLCAVKLMYKSWTRISQLSNQIVSYSGHNPSISELLINQFQTVANDMTHSSSTFVTLLSALILLPKLTLFKPSVQQLSDLQRKINLRSTSDDPERMNEKITQLQKIYNNCVDFGVFVLGFLSWVQMEVLAKIEMLQGNRMQKGKYTNGQSSSQLLLQTFTILSLWTGDNFHINFQSLQSYLQSNIQPIASPLQSSLMSTHYFPQLPVNNNSVKSHIRHLGSFQFLQFIFEFIPFDIGSQRQQGELYNMSMEYALDKDNHQFLNSQKAEKIRLNKIKRYLQFLTNKQLTKKQLIQ